MTQKERNILIGAGVLLGAMLLLGSVYIVILSPAAALDDEAQKIRTEIGKLSLQTDKRPMYLSQLRAYATRTYGDSDKRVDEQLSQDLVHMAERSGLDIRNLDVKSGGSPGKQGLHKEVKRNLTVRGKLEQVVNLLYCLQHNSRLHKIGNITITPRLRSGEVELQLWYSTLVLSTKPNEVPSAASSTTHPAMSQPAASQPVDLNGPDRARYQVIVTRDIFRPYIQGKAPPPEPVAVRSVEKPPTPEVHVPKRERKLKVVDLSSYPNELPEIGISDSLTGQIRTYKIGDALSGGKIVAVDYRSIPNPANPQVMSTSRVIIQYEGDFYSVELGQCVEDRRRLKSDELPPALLPSAAPSSAPSVRDQTPAATSQNTVK